MSDSRTAPVPEVLPFDPALADGTFTVIDRQAKPHLLPGVEGMSLMEIIRGFDLPIAATCGGAAACGTCHILVDPAFAPRLAAARDEEEWQLDRLLMAQENSRLACQLIWEKTRLDGLTVTLAPLED